MSNLVTATQLRESREAADAGVEGVADGPAEAAIRRAEARLNLGLGYKVSDGDLTTSFVSKAGPTITVPGKRVLTLTSVTDAYPGSAASPVDDHELRRSFYLFRRSGWRSDNTVTLVGTFGLDPDSDEYELAREFVLKLAVRDLATTKVGGGIPEVPGAFIRAISSEGTTVDFFTPTGATSGYGDLDALLDLIGRHPGISKTEGGLYTISTGITDIGAEISGEADPFGEGWGR